MKNFFNFINHNKQTIKEMIEYGFMVCAMVLMFLGRTGAIISFLSLLVIVISSNFNFDKKSDERKAPRTFEKTSTRRKSQYSKRYVA